MQLSELRKAARGAYLGAFDENEDPRFTNALLNQWFNEAHRDLAFTARLYRATKVLGVTLGADGVSWAGLPPDVIDVVPGTVRWTDGTSETALEYQDEAILLRGGPLYNVTNGTPLYYFLRAGAELGRQRMIVLHPGSDTARESGLLVGCWIYPDEMSDDSSSNTPAFQPPEHQWLVAQVVQKMALLDRALGRPDAPIDVATAFSREAETKLQEAQEQGRRTGVRRVLYEEDYW